MLSSLKSDLTTWSLFWVLPLNFPGHVVPRSPWAVWISTELRISCEWGDSQAPFLHFWPEYQLVQEVLHQPSLRRGQRHWIWFTHVRLVMEWEILGGFSHQGICRQGNLSHRYTDTDTAIGDSNKVNAFCLMPDRLCMALSFKPVLTSYLGLSASG